MNVRITHIDGKLPNMALMSISAYHRAQGDQIHFTRDVERGLFEPEYGKVYGSCIFQYSASRLQRFKMAFPEAIVGGTGALTQLRVERMSPADSRARFDGMCKDCEATS